jgi:flavorubredoxin
VQVINEHLKVAGFTVVDEGLKTLWNPDGTSRKACFEYGQNLAKKL